MTFCNFHIIFHDFSMINLISKGFPVSVEPCAVEAVGDGIGCMCRVCVCEGGGGGGKYWSVVLE